MIEHDFLTPFEEEVEREASIDHTLHGEERARFLQAVSNAEEVYKRLNFKENPQKRLEFEAFTPMLMAFASKNYAYIRINDENPMQIEVELKFAAILGDKSDYLISGGTLSRIFKQYRDFSLDVSPDNYVRLQFKVPLYDVTKSEHPVCE